ncbi:MAG: hypothetical protein ABSA96_12915 [Candidatus Acidiferrales bacterium]
MATLELRPLSLGELLDRTFFLYRRHFFLFIGISAIPYSLLLIVNLGNILFSRGHIFPQFPPIVTHLQAIPFSAAALGAAALAGIVGVFVFVTSFGATVFAVSEIILGRSASILASLRRASGKLATMFGVIVLIGLIFMGGLILFIFPAFYFMCRCSVAFAAAVLERVGSVDAVRRSFQLTKQFAGRAFVIYLLTFAIAFALVGTLQFPLGILLVIYGRHPSTITILLVLMQVGSFLGSVLAAPISTISFTLFYYDLRVRKEAFDLQMMMQAIGADPAQVPATGEIPSTFGRDVS